MDFELAFAIVGSFLIGALGTIAVILWAGFIKEMIGCRRDEKKAKAAKEAEGVDENAD